MLKEPDAVFSLWIWHTYMHTWKKNQSNFVLGLLKQKRGKLTSRNLACITVQHNNRLYLPLWNLKATSFDPYWRMWSICHLTISLGGSSETVNIAIWKRFRSKSFWISSKQFPLNNSEFDCRRRTWKDSSSGPADKRAIQEVNLPLKVDWCTCTVHVN